jgi:uncharacterized protein involved in response to NO
MLHIMVVVGGRVIPMFPNSGIPARNARRYTSVENLTFGTIIVLFVADVLQWSQAAIALPHPLPAISPGLSAIPGLSGQVPPVLRDRIQILCEA